MLIADILRTLFDTGHARNPANRNGASWNVKREDLPKLALNGPEVREMIQSYQDFHAEILEPFSFAAHGRAAIHDGHLGPATQALFTLERCACPDYPVEGLCEYAVAEATGSGSWPANCLPDWKDTHAITVNVNKAGMGSFLQPVWEDKVWPGVVRAYSEIGLMLVRKDGDARANLQTSFVRSSPGWIGLAIVPNNQSCSLSIWNRFKASYQPRNVVNEWTTLVMHEYGHNMGMGHSRGGVMNPYIIEGLPLSWKDDPSFPTLKRWFGGVPIANAPPGVRRWVAQTLIDDQGNLGPRIPLRPPIVIGA